MTDDSLEDLFQERREIRRQERQMRRAYKMSKYVETGIHEKGIKNLQDKIKSAIPSHMRPGNVGSYNKITWPFWFQVDFNFGTNPTWSQATRQTQSFQVTQEAAFLMTEVTLKNVGYDNSSTLAPLQVELRDRQSSRQLNDRAIPLQMFGKNSKPTILPTPMLVMPNAFIDVIASSWVPSGESMSSTGSGKFQLSFFGYRVRVEDADKVLSTIFG